MQATALTIADVVITVTAQFENSVNAYTDLSDCMTKRQIKNLLEKAETNEWYWSTIRVQAEYTDEQGNEYSAEAYLGACSYKSRQDFIKNSGYYEVMVQEVLEDLNNQLA